MATNELILGLNPNSVFPGQVVDASSVQVYFENIMVQTFEFDFDLLQLKSAVERSLLEIPSNARKFGDSDGKPPVDLIGIHAKQAQKKPGPDKCLD